MKTYEQAQQDIDELVLRAKCNVKVELDRIDDHIRQARERAAQEDQRWKDEMANLHETVQRRMIRDLAT